MARKRQQPSLTNRHVINAAFMYCTCWCLWLFPQKMGAPCTSSIDDTRGTLDSATDNIMNLAAADACCNAQLLRQQTHHYFTQNTSLPACLFQAAASVATTGCITATLVTVTVQYCKCNCITATLVTASEASHWIAPQRICNKIGLPLTLTTVCTCTQQLCTSCALIRRL